MPLLAVLCSLVAVVSSGALAIAVLAAQPVVQRPPFRAGISLHVHFFQVEYGDQRVRGQAVLLRGEPLEIEIGIVNPFPPGPRAAAEVDWLSRISITMSEGDRFESNRPLVANLNCEDAPLLRRHGANTENGHVLLEESGYEWYRCSIDPEELELKAGVYTIDARWIHSEIASSVLRLEYNSLAPWILQLEFRDIKTVEDALDRDIHLAMRALDAGATVDAETLATEVIRREPMSTSAHVIRGRARLAFGLCRAAQQDWEHAAAVYETGSDKRNRRSYATPEGDSRQRLAAAWREKARQLNCR